MIIDRIGQHDALQVTTATFELLESLPAAPPPSPPVVLGALTGAF